jgi:hypothetical protein
VPTILTSQPFTGFGKETILIFLSEVRTEKSFERWRASIRFVHAPVVQETAEQHRELVPPKKAFVC